MTPLLALTNVHFRFGDRFILKDVSLSIDEGSCTALIGPNGVGKTTLLRLASGGLHPTSGSILLRGEPLAGMPKNQRSRLVAIVPQQLDVPFEFTVQQIVEQGRSPYLGVLRGPRREDRLAVDRALDLADVLTLRDRIYNELSGGERQRVKIALGLAQEPKLLLLDEPTQNLDIGRQVELLDLLHSLRDQGLTILASIHDLHLIPNNFERVYLLGPGHSLISGPPDCAFNVSPHGSLSLPTRTPSTAHGRWRSLEVSVNSTASIKQLASEIQPVSEAWRTVARKRLDTLTKPLGSLGQLEDLAAQFVAIRGDHWQQPLRKGVYIFAADHGVTAEGVSAYPAEVTRQMVLNFLAGGAAVNVLARLNNAALTVIDVGVVADFENAPGLVRRKVACGTRNMRREPAMSEEQLLQALTVGADMANAAASTGQNLIAIGEMGIGNTTAASAIACALTGSEAAIVTGRGTGVDDAAYAHKVRIVAETVSHHFASSLPASPLTALRCVGGLEIAAMTGMMLQAARLGLVIVLDGFISTAAAAVALALAPACHGYMIAGHSSSEPGHAILLKHIGLHPLLSLNLRLGEGSGALLAMPLIEAALALYTEMATFDSAGVSEASA